MNFFIAILVASLAAIALPGPPTESLALLQGEHRARLQQLSGHRLASTHLLQGSTNAAPTLPMPPPTVYDADAAAVAAAKVAADLANVAAPADPTLWMPPQPVDDATAVAAAKVIADSANAVAAPQPVDDASPDPAAVAAKLAADAKVVIDANCPSIPCPFQGNCADYIYNCLQSKDSAMKNASVIGGYTHTPSSCSNLLAFVGLCGQQYCCSDNHKAANHSACRSTVGVIAHSANCSSGPGQSVNKTVVDAVCSSMATDVASGGVGATCNDTGPALAQMLETRAEQGHRATMQEGDEIERSLTDKCL